MQIPGAADVAEALERVYARPEFTVGPTDGLLGRLGDLWTLFVDWLQSLLALPTLTNASPIVFRLVTALLMGIALLAAVHFALRLPGLPARRPVESEVEPSTADPGPGDAAAWEARARTAAAEGRLREASLALYHAVVLRLEERGVVRYESGKTPGDYRREAGRHPDVAKPFERFVRVFLPLAFGAAPPGEGGWEALRLAAREIGVHA